MTDTIKRAADGVRVSETLDRSELWAVQTPQVFRRAALERALARRDEDLAAATDDALLVERDGGRCGSCRRRAENLKVTTPDDLRLAELLLASARGLIRPCPAARSVPPGGGRPAARGRRPRSRLPSGSSRNAP